MCGIAGIAGASSHEARTIITYMTSALAHRGPDDAGTFVDETVALGHRRLSVLDLSPNGHQPMWSDDERYGIVHNGEVYNFRSLRAQLEDRGHTFHSTGDTEVILKAFVEWGADCVHRFNGMFAFALYDRLERRLFLARDRLGIKPLYYARTEAGLFLFASEIRALLASGLVPRRLNTAALPAFLRHQAVPDPETLVHGIRMLSPGHRLVITQGRVEVDCYWHLLAHTPQRLSEHAPQAFRSGIRERLRNAVARRLVSDVPLGAFLSGGIDSSLIVALTSQVQAAPVNTFTVAFDHPGYQDGPYARQIARRFRTEHTEITLSDREVVERIPEALAAQDLPSADGINVFIIAQAARSAGMTVTLSGRGGDELFAGYPSFRHLRRQHRLRWLWHLAPPGLRKQVGAILFRQRPSIATEKIKDALRTDGSLAAVFPLIRQSFARNQVAALLGRDEIDSDLYTVRLTESFSRFPEASLLTKISFAEARTYMHDVLLRDTDQMSMAHGLEIRVPFLDHELVAYTMAVPPAAKQPNGIPKRLLVESFEALLPPEVVHRPKQGFMMPFEAWMRGPLERLCRQHLSVVADTPAFQADVLRQYWHAFARGNATLSWSRLWLLVALGSWMTRHDIER